MVVIRVRHAGDVANMRVCADAQHLDMVEQIQVEQKSHSQPQACSEIAQDLPNAATQHHLLSN